MKVIVRAFIRWFWVLILCLIVGYYAGKPVAKLLPPTYLATSTIELKTSAHGGGFVKSVTAYSSLVTSDAVLLTVLKKYPDLDATTLVGKSLTVVPTLASSNLSIEVTLPNAKEAARLANDLANTLVSQQNAEIKTEVAQEIKITSARITGEQNTINKLNAEIIKTPVTDTATINLYTTQQTQQENLQTSDIKTLQSLQEDSALNATPLDIVQAATAPSKPSSILGLIPFSPTLALILFITGLVAIILIEQRADRINTAYALQQKTKLPVLGALRWIRSSPLEVPLQTLSTSKQPYAEECKVMMADILFHAENAGAHILAVTATRPKAGTSSIASQLAALLAQSKRLVLLVDANLHNPVQQKRLGVANDAGLSRMLEDVSALKIHATPGVERFPAELPQQVGSVVDANWESYPTAQVPRVASQSRGAARIQNANGNGNGFTLVDKFPLDSYILPTKIPNLYVLPAGKPATGADPSSLLSMPEMEMFLQRLTKHADFIVIDCPSLYHAEAHVLGSLSDQTYLVVDVTKNRMKQVLSAKDELLSTSVKLSGLIANKLGRWI
ncbi:MAG: polysaccharide biosynthesis tyrosine autokinase [Ktedonobacteraceae bacterium]